MTVADVLREEFDRAELRVEREEIVKRWTGSARDFWGRAKSVLRNRAEERGWNRSEYWQALWEAACVLHDVQVSLQHEALLSQKVQNNFVWGHQPQSAIEAYGTDDPADIYRDGLLEAVARYESNSSIHTPELDWLFADALIYAEMAAYKESVANGSFIRTPNMAWLSARRNPRKAQTIRIVFFLIVWVIFPAALLAIEASWALGVWAIYLSYRFVRAAYGLWARGKAEKLLIAMRRAYAQCKPPLISPQELRIAVHAAREAGVVYDGALFILVDRMCGDYPNGLRLFG